MQSLVVEKMKMEKTHPRRGPLALAKEKQAAAYYRVIAGRTSLRSVKNVFHLLAEEESKHARWVEQMLTDTG